MRIAHLCLLIILCFGGQLSVESQAPEVIAAARRAAFPDMIDSRPLTVELLTNTVTTALGCNLIGGLRLPVPIDVYRLEFLLDDTSYAVHVSADGTLAQPCDQRFPNLGGGTMPVERAGADGDGDGLRDSADSCPQIAGIFSALPPGCPQTSDADRDGDGVGDGRDRCPDQAGIVTANGCALLRDEDRDGVPDHVDICAADFGIIRPDFAAGCPADGSGISNLKRASSDHCLIIGEDIPIFGSRSVDAAIIASFDSGQSTGEFAAVIGRTAASDWYQLASGWVKAEDAHLSGACYNIPLVNAAVGGATGCFMRPRQEFANVREAPEGTQVARVYATESQAVLGANSAGDWLFYRAGWVSRAVLELAGNCDRLPILNPDLVASGTFHFCPPAYYGFLRPRIDIGRGNTRVVSPTIANRLRAQPSIESAQIGEIPPRRVIDAVLDGPACNGAYVWWQVEVGGQVGWTVESDLNFNYYYLEPIKSAGAESSPSDNPAVRAPAAQEQPASRRLIHSANASTVDTIRRLQVESPRAITWSPIRSILALITGIGEIALYSYPDFTTIDSALNLPRTTSATAISFSPDERYLAIGHQDDGVSVAELAAISPSSGSITLDALAGPIRELAWSQSGDKLAAVSGDESLKIARQAGSLKLWNTRDGYTTLFHYTFPYPLTAVAFSADDRWLAVTGESRGDQRAGLWIYAVETGELAVSKALVYTGVGGFVTRAPTAALGDFVYSNGDSLYQIAAESDVDIRFYHRAGALLPQLTFRTQVLPGAEALMALTSRARNRSTRLHIVNAYSPYSLSATLDFGPGAIAFSPDGRFLAAAEPQKDQVLILGVTAE